MSKTSTFICFIVSCIQVNAEANCNKTHSNEKSQNSENAIPLTVHTSNPTYLINRDHNTNFFFISKVNPYEPPSEQLPGDQNSNSHNTIFFILPSTKTRLCDPNSNKSENRTVPTTLTTADVSTPPPCTPFEKTKCPPQLDTREKPASTTSSKKPNTPSSPTYVIPNGNPRDPSGYDMYCLHDGMYRANNFTCDQYYVCIHGIRYLMDCPYGLVFNDDLKVCDWLENVEGCYPSAFEDFVCPDDGYGFDDEYVLKFRYRDSCSQYVACHKRKPRLLSCEEGNSFDENSNDCVNSKNVNNCRNVEYSY